MGNKQERIIQWSCIFEAPGPFTSKIIAGISKIDVDTCIAHLDRLHFKGQLKRSGTKYSLTKDCENIIIKKLLREYQHYCFTKPKLIDDIMELMVKHEKMSGKDIIEHLEKEGREFNRTTIYKDLKSLERVNTIRAVNKVKRRAIEETYFEPNYEAPEYMKERILLDIQELFQMVGINVRAEFFEKAKEQKLYVLNLFRIQLVALVILDKHDNSACNLWEIFRDNILETGFPDRMNQFFNSKSNTDRIEEMKTLVSESNLNPAVLSLIYYFNEFQKTQKA